ncbi:putative nonsense-mediated mRNA decay protein [Fasciola gigantica]|uniref:60S ribosomal export protein NMD3 n=1 Tax=Fasciola gigantica TaxID=46835 RepID=A0A504YNA8_FASGI|nr:putative nonsense-mediated mRNA decay protein [Fasciola gigantica]
MAWQERFLIGVRFAQQHIVLICTRPTAAKDYWNACVQVRQRVDHKKTLINLEQTILRAGAHKECSNVKQIADGVDFYFGTRSQAVSFVNFLCKHAPCRLVVMWHGCSVLCQCVRFVKQLSTTIDLNERGTVQSRTVQLIRYQ